MNRKYYPSSEQILLGCVQPNDLCEYIIHGFALVNINNKSTYVSYCFTKPLIYIERTPEVDEVMRNKVDNASNIHKLVELFAKIRVIHVHYGDNEQSMSLIHQELEKADYEDTKKDFRNTIENMISMMFPKSCISFEDDVKLIALKGISN